MRITVSGAAIVAAAIVAGAGVAAQAVPDNFTLERAPSPVVVPSPSPTDATPTPTPTATSTPVAMPTPRTSPTPAAAPTATARSTPRATTSPRVSSTPATTVPSPALSGAPAAGSTPPTAAPTATPSEPVAPGFSPSTTAIPGTATDGGHVGRWWPAALVGALAALALAAWWRVRRRDAVEETWEETAEPVAPPPAPEPASMSTAPTPSAPPLPPATPAQPGGLITTALRPALDFEVVAQAAGIDTLRATLDYTLTIRNSGRAAAHEVGVEAWLFSFGNDPASLLTDIAALPASAPLLTPFALPAGAAIDLPAQAAVGRETLAVLTAGERRLFVPMLGVRTRYRDGGGAETVATAAFVVGVERDGQARLAPLALDRGARGWTTLGVRRFTG